MYLCVFKQCLKMEKILESSANPKKDLGRVGLGAWVGVIVGWGVV